MGNAIITKHILAQVLFSLCETEKFSKITIERITSEVGIHRKTFYYHFEDKYALLKWCYWEDSLKYLDHTPTSGDNWDVQAITMLKQIEARYQFYKNAIYCDDNTWGKFFTEIFEKNFYNLLCRLEQKQNLEATHKEFYARFFAHGWNGIISEWIFDRKGQTAEQVILKLKLLEKEGILLSPDLNI